MIPALKENLDRACDTEMIIFLGDRIVNMVVEQERNQVWDVMCALGGRGFAEMGSRSTQTMESSCCLVHYFSFFFPVEK